MLNYEYCLKVQDSAQERRLPPLNMFGRTLWFPPIAIMAIGLLTMVFSYKYRWVTMRLGLIVQTACDRGWVNKIG